MAVFYSLFFILACTLIINTANPKGKKVCCIICGITLWFLLAFKSQYIGIDSRYAYLPFFKATNVGLLNFISLKSVRGFEPGYVTFNNVISLFSKSSLFYFIVVASFIVMPISFIVYKYSKMPTVSFFIYAGLVVYHFSFSGIRQALAIGFCVIALHYLLLGKKVKFFSLILLASTFHVSAFIFVLLYPLKNVSLNNLKSVFILPVGFIVLLYLKDLISYIVTLAFGGDKYMGYVSENVDASYNLMIMYLLFFSVILQIGTATMKNRIYIWGSFLVVVCQSLGLVSAAGTRIGYYFLPLLLLAIPEAVISLKVDDNVRNIVAFLVCAFFVFFFYYTASGGYLDVVPYKFYWE